MQKHGSLSPEQRLWEGRWLRRVKGAYTGGIGYFKEAKIIDVLDKKTKDRLLEAKTVLDGAFGKP